MSKYKSFMPSSPSSVTSNTNTFNHGMISPSLLIQLKKILENYSDGLQILKEVIQNAEDAGATDASFILDLNNYSDRTDRLIHPSLAPYQGPALYCTNDAVFTEEDWTGVRMLSQSVKPEDPFKIGRHGNGFKSVFHLTDLPCMLSGDRLAIIDPLQKAFEASSYSVSLTHNSSLYNTLRDQVEPYMGVAGCDSEVFGRGFYQGTIFRLPLRNKPSQLSSLSYSKEKVYKMFEALEKEAHLMLLFLTSLSRLSLMEKDRSGHLPRILFKAELAPSCLDEVMKKRMEFRRDIKASRGKKHHQVTTSFEMTILTEKYLTSSNTPLRKTYNYLVTHHYDNSITCSIKNLLPSIATAMFLHCPDPKIACHGANNGYHGNNNYRSNHACNSNYGFHSNGFSDNEHVLNLRTPYKLGDDDGRLFAYLPLPLDSNPFTGFPILIHGAFVLEKNLSQMNWTSQLSLLPPALQSHPLSPTSPTKISDERSVRWNQVLLKTLLPVCYCRMVCDASKLACLEPEKVSVRAVYRAFPDLQRLSKNWEPVCHSLYLLLAESPIFYCSLTRQWSYLKDCVFNSPDVTDDVEKSIDDVMKLGKVKMVACPDHVLLMLKKWVKHQMTFVSAALVAEVFRDIQHNHSFRWESRMMLLRYFLKQPHLEHLDKLHLLPLANGGFEEFKFHSSSRPPTEVVYVTAEQDVYSLLSSYQDCLLELDIEDDLRKILITLAHRRTSQLTILDPPTVCRLFSSCLPPEWVKEDSKSSSRMNFSKWPVAWTCGVEGQPVEGWLKALWNFLVKNYPRDLSCVDRLPVLPCRSYNTTLRSKERVTTDLIPMAPNQVVVCRNLDNFELDSHVEVTLTQLDIWVINELPVWIRSHPVICRGEGVFSPSCVNILKALEMKSDQVGGSKAFVEFFNSRLQPQHKSSLRRVFSNLPSFNLAKSSLHLLSCLPFFETLEGGTLVAACDVNMALIQAVSSPSSSFFSPSLSQLPFKFSTSIIDCTRPETANLARLTGVRLLNIAQVLTQVVIPDLESGFYDISTREAIIHFIFSNYEAIVQMDLNIRRSLKTLPFMPKADKQLSVDHFYDPTIPLLQKMFLYEENFPPPTFTSPATIAVFKKLGLRDEKDVRAEDIKESALLIQQLSTVGNMAEILTGLNEKSTALLFYIQSHKHKLPLKCDGVQLSDILKTIKWVRSMDRPSASSSSSSSSSSSFFPSPKLVYPDSLPWFGGYDPGRPANLVFFSPTQMTLKEHILTCASTTPIVECLSLDLVKHLAVATVPSLSQVLHHLNNIIHFYNTNHNQAYSRIVVAVYNVMANSNSQELLHQLIQDILPEEWAWCGDGFVRPTDLILNRDSNFFKKEQPATNTTTATIRITSPMPSKALATTKKIFDLRPYVYVLPDELQHLKLFFSRHGVSESLDAMRVISHIRRKYSGGVCFRTPEVDEDLLLCLELLKRVASQRLEGREKVLSSGIATDRTDAALSQTSPLYSDPLNIETFGFEHSNHTSLTDVPHAPDMDLSDLYLPTFEPDSSVSPNRIRFGPLSKCVHIEDNALMHSQSFASELLQSITRQGLYPVHSSIPQQVCQLLGIPCFHSKSLSPLAFSKAPAEATRSTTHATNMSNRNENHLSFTEPISNLVQPFLVDPLSLPIEMVQNADDAGATEIRFLLDERTHSEAKTSLLDENMQHWQGPALWIYNDGVMTDDDFAEAFILSSVAKQANLEKIGRHGRGLCSVYAVTDVPSFVSKNWVVFFDPHMKYLGRSLKEKTKFGLRINLSRFRKQLSSLGDQFKPYEGVFGWSTRNSDTNYPATLFRLPLRLRSLASKSDIHKVPFEAADVKNLFRKIFENSENLLLFTQNIMKVSCYHLSNRGSPSNDISELFTISKRGVKMLRELKPEIHVDSTTPVYKNLNKDSQRFVKQSSVLKASNLFMRQLLSRGNASTSQIPDSSTVISFDARVFMNGEKHLRLKSGQFSKPWLVVGCFGKDEILTTAAKCQDLLPYSGVAIPLEASHNNKHHYRPLPLSDDERGGLLFNFLPTHIRTGLPVHVNGSFLMSEDHQAFRRGSSMRSSDYVGWNEKLLAQVTSAAYLKLLSDLASFSPTDPSHSFPFHLAWPDAMLTQPEFLPVVKNLYKEICRSHKTTSPPPFIFSDGRCWYPFENICFLDCDYEDDALVEASVEVGNKIMKQTNASKILLCLPKQVLYGFQLADALKLVQSKTYNKAQFFEKIFLPYIGSIPEKLRDPLVFEALRSIRHNSFMVPLLKNCSCISTGKLGILRLEKPTKLIDPTSKLALLYRGTEASFPSEKYTKDEEVLEGLKFLGMRSEPAELSWDEVIERCKQVHHMRDPSLTREAVCVLLQAMNSKLNNENDQSLSNLRHIQLILHNINFLPSKPKPDDFLLPWHTSRSNDNFYKPSDLYPSFYTDILCCVQPIVNDQLLSNFSNNLITFLKLSNDQKLPMVAQVVDQLDAVATLAVEREMGKNPVLMRNVQQVCAACYTYLQDVCTSNNKLQQQSIFELLQNRRFVLVDDVFLTCKQLAFSFPYDLRPIFFQLPSHYKAEYAGLFSFLNVGEYFTTKDYVEALKALYDSNKNKALYKESLTKAKNLVGLFKNSLTTSGLTFDDANKRYGPIYVPDHNGILRSVNRLDLTSTHRLPSQNAEQKTPVQEPRNYLREQQTATPSDATRDNDDGVFPFEPVSVHPLSRCSFPLELGITENNVINEKNLLISRVRKVMCGRASDRDVLKEILRVADDIGSSEMSIIKDTQRHNLVDNCNHSSLNHNYFKHMQAPAICIQFNKAMNQQQINSILRTGHCKKGLQTPSSSSSDPSKSGLYGTGFDSVYKITDIPSVLAYEESNGFMCLFEPQGKFLQDTSKLEPGRVFEDLEQLEQLVPGVFSCFLNDKFKPHGATMIRLPLRTPEIVKSSELSDEALNEDFIDELFEKLKQEIFDCMLFLKQVTTVTMFDITSNHTLKETYRISLNTDESNVEAKNEFNRSVEVVLEEARKTSMRLIDLPSHEITYPVMISDNMGQWEKWVLSHRFGLDASAEVPSNINENIKRRGLVLAPAGGVAAMLDFSVDESHKRCSKVFTRLPLSQKINMPTHLNANFCVDKETGKQLWSDSDLGLMNDWNNLLLKYIVAPAYVSILAQIPSMLGNVKSGSGSCVYVGVLDSMGDEIPELDRYTKLFPILNRQTPQGYLKLLIESVYKYIDYKQAAVIPVSKSLAAPEASLISSSPVSESTKVEWFSTRVVGYQKPYFDNLKESYREMDEKLLNMATPSPSATSSTPSFSTPVSTQQGKKRRSRFHMKKNAHEIVRGLLVNCGFKLAKLPIAVFESFTNAGVVVSCVSPKAAIDFFKCYSNLPSVVNIPPLPCEISQTALKDEINLKFLLEYCSQDIPYFRSNLDELPLLLCEDGLLKQFSSQKDRRVFLSSAHMVSPGFEAMFVHHSLVGSVFKEADVEACDVFLRFDVKAFADHLPSILDRIYQVEAAVSRDGASKASYQDVWLRDVWSFLADEYQRTYEHTNNNSMQQHNELEMVENLLKPISNWCLLPVKLRQKTGKSSGKSMPGNKRLTADYLTDLRDETIKDLLVPISSSFMVLDYSSDSISGNQIRKHFGRLGVFELDVAFFDDSATPASHSNTPMRCRSPALFNLKQSTPGVPNQWLQTNKILSFIRIFVSTPEFPKAILKPLDKVLLKPEGPENIGMNLEESIAILTYFSNSMDVWKSNSIVIKSLMLLPVHLAVDGRLVPIHNDEKTYLLKQNMLETDIELLQKRLKLNLLRQNVMFESLYEVLGCQLISLEQLYSDYLFKNFDLFSHDSRLHHLTFIKNTLFPALEPSRKEHFKATLMCSKVLPDEQDTRILKKPMDIREGGEFASRPSLSSFKPAAPFNNDEWLEFFEKKSFKTRPTLTSARVAAPVMEEVIPSSEELLTTARHIASKGKKLSSKENSEEVQRAQSALEKECQLLMKHLLHPKVVCKKNFLENLATIAFIPAVKVPSSYTKIHAAYIAPNFSNNEALSSTSSHAWLTFKDCLPYKHMHACWTCSYILPEWADPLEKEEEVKNGLESHVDKEDSKKDMADRLGYNEEPSVEVVVEHVQNICKGNPTPLAKSTASIADDSTDVKQNLKADVLKKIFDHLQHRIDDVCDQQALNDMQKSLHKLLNVKCIMVDIGKFVAPRQVAINLYEDDQVPPYLCQTPSDLGQFKRVLLSLGVSNIASPEQYALALDNISAQTGGEKLHPNELRLTFTAVRGLFEALRRLRYRDVDPLSKLHWLYLPTVSGYMHRSTSMFFNDDQPSSIIFRLQRSSDKKVAGRPFLVDLSECRLSSDDHADLISLLPKRLQPIFLSQALTEHLDTKCRETVVYHSIADKLKYQMTSKMFSRGIVRLIKHERSTNRNNGPVRQTMLDSIEQSLKKIRIQGVDKVVTYLAINSRPLRGTEAELESFAEKTVEDKEDVAGSEIWNIYINKLACFSEELQTSVSEAVNKMTGGLLRHSIHYIQPILSCLPHSIPKVLDKLAIKPDTPSSLQTSDASNQPTLPTPGSLVPKEDHHLLKEDFEEFDQGEYIGYELEDEEGINDGQRTIIYAIVLEKMVEEDFETTFGSTTPSPGPPGSDKKRGRSGSHYSPQRTRSRTGLSMSSDPEHHKFTQKYRINVGEKRPPAIAPVTDLYKFHRVKGRKRWNGGANQEDSFKSATTPTSPYPPSTHPGDEDDNVYHADDSDAHNRQHQSRENTSRASSTKQHAYHIPNRSPRQPFTDNNLFVDEDNDTNINHYDNFHEDERPYNGDFIDHNFSQQQKDIYQQQHQQHNNHHQKFSSQHHRQQQQQDMCKYDEEWGSKHQNRNTNHSSEQKPSDGPQYNDSSNGDDVITTEKVMGEVSDALEEAWLLPEPQRKKVVKRLLLRWHPDKNIGNEEFATVITQHVQAELERLELGLPRPSNFDPSQFDFDPRNPFSNSTSFKQNFANAYKYFFDQMNQRAKEHKQQRERYKENRDNSASDGYFFQGTNPQPGQAKRFLRQAQEDLRAADNDFDALDPAYEWTCFKAHQAAEKALKAAQFAVDAVTSFSHDLVTLAASLEDTELRRLAQKLQKIVGNSNRLYNPDPMDFTVIPHEEFNKDMACDAIMCAVDILERVKEFVELRDL